MKKKALVIHSGGMDSSLCLALAIQEHGVQNVLSLSFSYHQSHTAELVQAEKICKDWKVDHTVISIECLREITENALTHPKKIAIQQLANQPPTTLVQGRNGLMARLGAIHANYLQAHIIYMGVIEVDSGNSGYRDCSRAYMDMKQTLLRMDLGDPLFEIRTPLVQMSKKETLILANQMGILEYLLEETVTCYRGLRRQGCEECPACVLRNEGLRAFYAESASI